MRPTCTQIAQQASDRLDGRLGFLARRSFDRHLASCEACRAYAQQLEVTRLAMLRLPAPEVPPALRDSLLATFDALAATGDPVAAVAAPPRPRRAIGALVGTAAILLAIVASGHHVSRSAADLLVFAGLGAVALAIAAFAHRQGRSLAAAGWAAAVLAAIAVGRGGPLDPGEGVMCVSIELASAGLVAALAWAGARRVSPRTAGQYAAGGAMAGALAADAGLQLTCGAHLALAHLALFHVLGVAVVAAAGLVLVRARLRASGA